MDPLPNNPDFPLGNSSPPIIPDHELLRCIGRGSYGEVYLARNLMGSFRAVKVVYRKTFAHSRPYDRELAGIQKFEPVSRSHEGLVDLLHVGNNDAEGYFYYIMELGDDLNRGKEIDPDTYVPKTVGRLAHLKGRLSLDESLQLGLSLTSALASLHKQGLVHRDIKPSNIIFVDGVPKLADVGLVARVDDEQSYVGTEGFIPPEGPGAPQADIYSLGKVLYEISTGKDRHDFPELPTLLDENPEAKRFLELNEVIIHACKAEVGKRYQAAADMHADLVLVDNGGSVKRLKLLERRLTNFKRAAGPALIALFALTVVAYEIYRSVTLAAEARQRQVGSKLTRGVAEMEAGQMLEALPPLVEALRLDRGEHETLYRMRIGSVLEQAPKLVSAWFGAKPVYTTVFNPEGNQLLIAERHGKARVYDAITQKPISPFFGQDTGLYGASFDPTGQFVATTSELEFGNAVCVWNALTGALLVTLPHTDKVFSANFSPDGTRIVTSCQDQLVRIWDWSSGHLDLSLPGHTNIVAYATYSPNGKCIASCGKDGTARLWDAKTGQQLGLPVAHKSWVRHVAFSPDSTRIVTAGLDNRACVWEIGPNYTKRRLMPELKHLAGVFTAEFSPDGLLIVTACLDGTIRLWDATTLQPLALNSILRHGSQVMATTFSPDAHRLVTGCWDGTTRIWELAGSSVSPTSISGIPSRDGRCYLVQSNSSYVIRSIANKGDVASFPGAGPTTDAKLNRNGRFVAILKTSTPTANQGDLQLWDVATATAVSPVISTTSSLAQTIISDDGRLIAIVAGNKIQLISSTAGTLHYPVLEMDSSFKDAQFSPDSHWLAVAHGNSVSIWKLLPEPKLTHRLKHDYLVAFVTFSSDSRRLVTGCGDQQFNAGYAQSWSVMTGTPVGAPLRHSDGVLYATISPDGKKIVTTGEDFTAMIWDAESGHPLVSPLRHPDQVLSAAFSLDAKRLVTVCRNQTAQIWDAESGEAISPPLQHPAQINFASFTSDGIGVVTSGKGDKFWLWYSHPDQHSLKELSTMSRLFTGQSDPPIGEDNLTSFKVHGTEWDRLKSTSPADFTVSEAELFDWHLHHANSSEEEELWSAARFHLRRLAELKPNNDLISERLRRITEYLQKIENQ